MQDPNLPPFLVVQSAKVIAVGGEVQPGRSDRSL